LYLINVDTFMTEDFRTNDFSKPVYEILTWSCFAILFEIENKAKKSEAKWLLLPLKVSSFGPLNHVILMKRKKKANKRFWQITKPVGHFQTYSTWWCVYDRSHSRYHNYTFTCIHIHAYMYTMYLYLKHQNNIIVLLCC